MARFDEIMATVLKWEGGFVDNPFDNGGPTNMGITHVVLAQWRGLAGVTRAEVKALGQPEAVAIFKDRYWKRIGGKALPAPVDLVMMDGAVNHGVPAMARLLQNALGVEDDGRIGTDTLTALAAQTPTPAAVLALAVTLAEARKTRYLGHEDARHFIHGWRNRLNDVMAVALNGSGMSWTFGAGTGVGTGAPATEPQPGTTFVLPVIEDVDLQALLLTVGLYAGDLDGVFGSESAAALDAYLLRKSAAISGNWQGWPVARRKIALGQLLCHDLGIDAGRIDGLIGPTTIAAFEAFNRKKHGLPADAWRDEIDALPAPGPATGRTTGPATGPATGIVTTRTTWPTEADVPSVFGALGTGCALVPLKRLVLPYRMRLSWDLGTWVDGIRLHEKVHDSAARVFDKVYAHYGDAGVAELGLDLFGGTTGCRKKRNGTSWSMHAWSIAIDFDPARNELDWNHTRARLAKPDAVRFWELWEAEGWVSLGRARDFDWMHIQAARP